MTTDQMICFNTCRRGRDFIAIGRELFYVGFNMGTQSSASPEKILTAIEEKRRALGLGGFEAEHMLWLYEFYQAGKLSEEQRN